MTGTRLRDTATAMRMSSPCSAGVKVDASPVVPQTISAVAPRVICRSQSRSNASPSTSPLSSNGVGNAGAYPDSFATWRPMVGIAISQRMRAQSLCLNWPACERQSGHPALARRIVRGPRDRRFAGQVKFEDAGNGDNGPRLVSVFKSDVSKRLGAIDEEAAADPVLVLDHPVSSSVPTNHEQWRFQTRRRFGVVVAHWSSSLMMANEVRPRLRDRQIVIVLRDQRVLAAEQFLLDRFAMPALA